MARQLIWFPTDATVEGTFEMAGGYYMDGTADEGTLHGEYEATGEGMVEGSPRLNC